MIRAAESGTRVGVRFIMNLPVAFAMVHILLFNSLNRKQFKNPAEKRNNMTACFF